MGKAEEKKYVLYDGRALYDEDDASVLEVCNSRKEALFACEDWGEAVVFEYDCVNTKRFPEGELQNGRQIHYHNKAHKGIIKIFNEVYNKKAQELLEEI